MKISERQRELLQCLAAFQDKEGYPPSIREVCAGLHLKSPGSLHRRLRDLEALGMIEKSPGKKRSMRLTRKGRLLAGGSSSSGIPLLGRIAAGAPILAEENREEELPIDPSIFGADTAFALRVRGDSMKDRQIRDGDLAVIRPQQDADSGDVVAVRIRGIEPEATLKILRRSNGRLELLPANDDYEPLVFVGEEQAAVEILGKLIGVIRTRP